MRQPQPFGELRPPPPSRGISNRNGDCLLLPHQHNQLLASRDAGIKQISLKHGVVLGHDRYDYRRILRTLAFVDGHGVGRHQRVEFAKPLGDGAAVKAGGEFAIIGIDVVYIADVTVINILCVVVLNLHYLIAGGEGPPEALDPTLARRFRDRPLARSRNRYPRES